MSNSPIWPVDRTLSGTTTLSQNGPGSYGNEGVLCMPQSSSINEVSKTDGLVSYPRHSLRETWFECTCLWVDFMKWKMSNIQSVI